MDTSMNNMVKKSENLMRMLEERLEVHDNSRKAAQDKLHEICNEMRKQIDDFENKIKHELEDNFIEEDIRLQSALNDLSDINMDKLIENNINNLQKVIQKAKAELLVMQSYEIFECENKKQSNGLPNSGHYGKLEMKKNKAEPEQKYVLNLTKIWNLKVDRKFVPEMLELRKPKDIRVSDIKRNVSIQFTHLNTDEKRVLSERNLINQIKYKCLLSKKGSSVNDKKNYNEYILNEIDNCFKFAPKTLEFGITYEIRVKAIIEDKESEWSDETAEFTPEFSKCCAWKECPDYVEKNNYFLDENNPRIVTKVGNYNDTGECTIIGNASIPLNKVTSWNIKILKSMRNNGFGIYVGVASADINQHPNSINSNNYGWYLNCYYSTLNKFRKYGPRKEKGNYVHTGDSVGVVMDTTKSELSFVLNGINHGVAYKGISLDKPLVPCVILWDNGDSVEIDPSSGVKESEAKSSVNVPSNITAKSNTWDSITLSWDAVKRASFYQIEMDDKKFSDIITVNTFTKWKLLPETEHYFRVRTVKGNKLSEWSGVIKGSTLKAPDFSECTWKESTGYAKYTKIIDKNNPRIATMSGICCCTIIGNTLIPPNKVTSWNIKILKSKENDRGGIFIGVAPFDINQNEDNYRRCGWYFDCYRSMLYSGPPHKYRSKKYGPRKKGVYVHEGDIVGVVMDTTKGELSFVVNGINCGVAYERIPLDKPLVPCVLLNNNGDSVEFDTSEIKENKVDTSIPVPFNTIAKSIIWDSNNLKWNKVDSASCYEIEVDGNKSWNVSKSDAITKRGLLPETDNSFREHSVINNKVYEWSDAIEGRRFKESFEISVWKDCPVNAKKCHNYSVDKNNPRISTTYSFCCCDIIRNTSLPPNKITSWNIKILKSKKNYGKDIYIGVAPFDINQNENDNYNKSGWYFNCCTSTLCSGPPHNYSWKQYGTKKKKGDYVHTGDSVGVVMDTTKDELSFVVNGVNLGVAYEGISLNKPLVPCVLLNNNGDSVEFDTSEIKENKVDTSIPIPSNIITKSDTWNSITLTWNKVEGISFYLIEVDRRKSWNVSKSNALKKRGLLPETDNSFRVRAVKNNESEWRSDETVESIVAEFREYCISKKCPNDVDGYRKYFIDENKYSISSMTSNDFCTIIKNTLFPPNKITSWNIKILKSRDNDGKGIYIGVAPFDISQNDDNYCECGWYFNCYKPTLWSGPLHYYISKEYGLRKEKDDKYIRIRDIIGIMKDTINDKLSSVLNEITHDIPIDRIPLDHLLNFFVILG